MSMETFDNVRKAYHEALSRYESAQREADHAERKLESARNDLQEKKRLYQAELEKEQQAVSGGL